MAKANPQEKPILHPRNLHHGSYDLEALAKSFPGLAEHILTNSFGNQTIDFSDPNAVKALNKALLIHFYQVDFWDIPEGFLIPPIPGRADYIHYLADLLASKNQGKVPKGTKVQALDIGTGANLIYPLIGSSVYSWSFVAAEIEEPALKNAQEILAQNPTLNKKINLRKQENESRIFKGIIQHDEYFDLTLCNPPFHSSAQEARQGSQRKAKNLNLKSNELNFGGQSHELWCKGGELEFVGQLIQESAHFKNQCFWFTSLISKEANLKPLTNRLRQVAVSEYEIIEMAQGNKKSRFLAWTYLNSKQQENWSKFRWK
ncbi:23S rRNA m(6)A-1618 methyltransferase [Algoriphagus ornithinivorans]|uniref:Ribosomal RNA large subunit methyltransferase F n=1 Tax=Algoriphagus ornithinivorans TaxID=226506 RepID=A0A1I5FR55_9BACT|nr:23S rRNA (adenine(1618)-N(6))-methyltransferase RlmF [Algoriphagus ornithinivorans]SFO26250.1 23S rRNA m(6)A-1618 methyltransferase [Algoriphagus ornithinivorans]